MKLFQIAFFVVLMGVGANLILAQIPADSLPSQVELPEAYVVFKGDTLFEIQTSLGPFTPKERAQAIEDRLDRAFKDVFSIKDTLAIREGDLTTDLVLGELVMLSVSEADAEAAGMTRLALAEQHKQILNNCLNQQLESHGLRSALINIGLLIVAFAGLILLFFLARKAFDWVQKKISALSKNFFFRENTVIRFFNLITPRREREILMMVSRVLKIFTYIAIIVLYLPLVFNFLPWTRPYVRNIFSYILYPLKAVWEGVLDFIPDLFFIVIILVITNYVVRFLKFVTNELEQERVVIHGFYKDWAQPTFKLVRVIVYAFSLVIIFPYLPGSDSPAFQGVSIFLGLLFSLGSTSAIANIVAGIVITYMRPFQIGDRVKIGDSIGDIVERTLLVTRIRTIKNEDITIPNSQILGGHMKNYSLYAQEKGLILNTGVTIGYDVPWKTVHDLLIHAALEVPEVEKTPLPFVLQTSLDDFYVSYQLNAYTKMADRMAAIYSDIHRHILDKFNEANVEILSPHYGAIRDGHQVAIPVENIKPGYETPAFRIDTVSPSGSSPKED